MKRKEFITNSALVMAAVPFGIYRFPFLSRPSRQRKNHLKLWYRQPANAAAIDKPYSWKSDPEWLKALPLGNGSLGVMVFGDVNKERIQLSEESMWSGSPDDNNNPEAYPALRKIRELLFQEKYKEALELTQQTQICKGQGSGNGNGAKVPFGSFQTLGDLWLDFENQEDYENYHRELDLEDAVVRVSYTQNGVQHKREIFVSYPDQVMVMRLTSNTPGKISFKASLNRPEKYKITTEENQLIMYGALYDGKGGDGLHYMTRLSAVNKNGSLTCSDSSLVVQDADEVTLFLTASTGHVLEYPHYTGRDFKRITDVNLQKGKQKSYKELLKAHTEDYQKYYKRVSFNITGEAPDTIPTDIRVQSFIETESDPVLEELLFQYGRYLLISSSRPGTLPANLQGLWSNKIQTPWNGDYHTNVNVQMNYWLAEVTHLGEMHLPLFKLTESLQKPGSKTAKVHYNASGWVVHPITNVWGYTSPGEVSKWGMHAGGGAWLTTHIMEHYYFTLDTSFLKEMFPVLKSSVQFYLDWLVPDPVTGELLSGPSVSPENTFIAPDGSLNHISMGPAHDQQVIWQLFKNYIDAANILEISDAFLQQVMQAQTKLAKPKVGSDGRLMEWNKEFEEAEPGHRHISHLFALHPGYQIDLHGTPELAHAARKSLDYRIKNGGGHTGWSAAWLINQYARLEDAKNAKQSLNTVLLKSTSPNLFGLHPPFQMDANFGTTAGIAEMLIQSQSGEIRLLPALPKEWRNGEISGLRARAGFVVDMKWESGELNYVNVYSEKGGICKLNYKGEIIVFETEPKKNYAHELRNRKITSPGNTTYYIDPKRGDDEYSGLKENRAWRSFRHVNQMQFSPGDKIEITSPGSFNQTLMLTANGLEENPVRVHFAEGHYDFFTDNAYRGKYNISNTNASPDSGKAVGILLKNTRHVEISGKGAKIVSRGKMIMVCVDSCENISVSDLTFDYHRPTISEYAIAEVSDDYTDIKIHKDSDYKIEEGKLIWVGEGWSYETGLTQELNLQTNEVRRMRRDPLVELEFKEVRPFVVRARGNHNLKPGMVYQIRNPFRDYAAVFTRRSKNISWSRVNFQFLHGMGLVSQFSENLTYNSVDIAPDSTSGRTTSAWADMLHISGCKGKVLIKDCIFSGAHDDAINVHGTYLSIVEKLSDKQIKVRFMHEQTYGFMAVNPGDEIEFVNRESLESYGKNKVSEAVLLNPKEMLLTLTETAPDHLKLEDVIENVTWTPELEVRGCEVHRIPTRGFILKTRRKILIEDNEFFRTHMSAILVKADANQWYESGPVRDLTIRNNKFKDCAEPVIYIHPENSIPNNDYHQNILIENNDFVLRNELIVAAKSTKNLNITGNNIFSEKKLNDDVSIKHNDCSDVGIKQNSYLDKRD